MFVLELSKKTVKANAMGTGLGTTKRIYISDTLLHEFSPEEIEVVVAHELTHDKNKDIAKHIVVTFLIGLVSFFVCDLALNRAVGYFGFISKADVANVPLLCLLISVVGLIILPLQNGFSRLLERAADTGAIRATGNKAAFISMITKLGKKNLADFTPSRLSELFLYDHPPIGKRITFAQTVVED